MWCVYSSRGWLAHWWTRKTCSCLTDGERVQHKHPISPLLSPQSPRILKVYGAASQDLITQMHSRWCCANNFNVWTRSILRPPFFFSFGNLSFKQKTLGASVFVYSFKSTHALLLLMIFNIITFKGFKSHQPSKGGGGGLRLTPSFLVSFDQPMQQSKGR